MSRPFQVASRPEGLAVGAAVRDPCVLGFTFLGLCLRVWYSLAKPLPLAGDQISYEQLAHNFKSYWGLGFHTPSFWATGTVVRPPLYPFFLAVNYSLGLRDGAVRVQQGIVLSAACLALSLLVVRGVDLHAGRVTAAIGGLLPPLITIPNAILSDTLAASLCAFSLCLLVLAWDEPSFRRFTIKLMAASFLAAAATLTHPNEVVMFALVAVTGLFGRRGWRHRSLAAGAAALAALVLFVPWMIRNEAEAHTLTPLAKNEATGNQLAAGVHFPVYKAAGEFGAKKRSDYYFNGSPPGLTRAQALSRPLTITTSPLVNAHKTLLHNIVHHPLKQVSTSLFWEREMWLIAFDDRTQYGTDPVIPWLLTEALHLLMLMLVLVGAWLGRRLVLVRMALAFAVLVSLPYLVVIPSPRYALPAVLVLISVAGIGLSALLRGALSLTARLAADRSGRSAQAQLGSQQG